MIYPSSDGLLLCIVCQRDGKVILCIGKRAFKEVCCMYGSSPLDLHLPTE